jgi:acyl dehydratase
VPPRRGEPTSAEEATVAVQRVFDGVESVKAAVGEHLGYSDWLEITQERVNLFAEATGDYQWIHVDEARAAASPFGGTIAHGYLTLSLTVELLSQVARYEGFTMAINYGADKVRFISPVMVGKRVRAGAELVEVTDVSGGIQIKVLVTVEIEGSEKPACVIESLTRWLV